VRSAIAVWGVAKVALGESKACPKVILIAVTVILIGEREMKVDQQVVENVWAGMKHEWEENSDT